MRNVHIYTDGPAPVFKKGPPNVRVADCDANCGCSATNDAKLAAIMDSLKSGSMTLKDANGELKRLHINGTIVWDGTVFSRIAQ